MVKIDCADYAAVVNQHSLVRDAWEEYIHVCPDNIVELLSFTYSSDK